MTKVITHPTSVAASIDRNQDRENLARQIRTTQMMREQAREQINANEILSELDEIGIELRNDKDIAGNKIPHEREIMTALKIRADIKLALLKKVLPDLKATESVSYSAHDHMHQHAHAHVNVTNMELAQRLQLWRRDHGAEIEMSQDLDNLVAPEPLRSSQEQQAARADEITTHIPEVAPEQLDGFGWLGL